VIWKATPASAPDQSGPGLGHDAAEHGDIVPQHQQFRVLGRRRAAEQHKPASKPNEDQIEQLLEPDRLDTGVDPARFAERAGNGVARPAARLRHFASQAATRSPSSEEDLHSGA